METISTSGYTYLLCILIFSLAGCAETGKKNDVESTDSAVESNESATEARNDDAGEPEAQIAANNESAMQSAEKAESETLLQSTKSGLTANSDASVEEPDTEADERNLDAVRQDIASIAASAQGFFIKPSQLGGGGDSYSNVTFKNLVFPVDMMSPNGLKASNSNGTYVIMNRGSDRFDIEAYPSSLPGYVPGQGSGSLKMFATVTSNSLDWTSSVPID